MSTGLAAGEPRDLPRRKLSIAGRGPQREATGQRDQAFLLAVLPVVGRRVSRRELVERAAPERPGETIVETPGLVVEQVQNPTPSGAGSGLVGSPGRTPPSLYSEGATSFGPSG
jgi:hypothetical protein